MTNEEAKLTIDYLKSIQEGYIEGEGYEMHPLPEWYALDKAIDLILQTRWTPVSERLPEESADVICSTDAKEVFMASYLGKLDDGSECFDDDNGMMCEGDVIAWMPLPEPYKAERELQNEAN